jgi:hypothetical protein
MDAIGIVILVVIVGTIAVNFANALFETLGWDQNRVAAFLRRIAFQPSQVTPLAPYQVGVVSVWYFICLAVAVYLPYALLASPDLPLLAPESSRKLLDVLNANVTAQALVQCFSCGVIGATLYGILWISRIQESATEWYFRRYLLLPVLGGFLGSCSYLFVKAGLITVQQSSAGTPDSASVSPFAVWGIAFLSGFASRELTAKLVQISEAVFARAPETSPLGPISDRRRSSRDESTDAALEPAPVTVTNK